MKPLASTRRLAIEAALAAGAGAAVSAAVYADWWQQCCRSMSGALILLSIPSYIFAILVGGGVHSATKVHYYGPSVRSALVPRALVCSLAPREARIERPEMRTRIHLQLLLALGQCATKPNGAYLCTRLTPNPSFKRTRLRRSAEVKR